MTHYLLEALDRAEERKRLADRAQTAAVEWLFGALTSRMAALPRKAGLRIKKAQIR